MGFRRVALVCLSGAVLAWTQACTIFDGQEARLQNGGAGGGATGAGGAQVGAGGTGGEAVVGGSGGNPAGNCAEGSPSSFAEGGANGVAQCKLSD